MNLSDKKYTQFSLCNEMFQTCEIVRNFDQAKAEPFAKLFKDKRQIFITGEGSSRLFPAYNLIHRNVKNSGPYLFLSESSSEAAEFNLNGFGVVGLSNSGRTKELVGLFDRLHQSFHQSFASISANGNDAPVAHHAKVNAVLDCGSEKAVAATKSVMEQALFLDAMAAILNNNNLPDLQLFSHQLKTVLELSIPKEVTEIFSNATVINIAGRSTGVGAELALKTNEITRKKSTFLPGTYALHGIEEVMDATEVLLIIDPFPEEEAKFHKVIAEGVGMKIVAIAARETSFPTIRIPFGGFYHHYLELAAGWNILVETGLALGIDLDKGLRARKIGNEV
jgi:glutamine---fructose-6-phosphate transaminase (isomerizing)